MSQLVLARLIGVGLYFGLTLAGVTSASATDGATAGPLERAACYVFGGREDCRTVRVFDAQECIIKIHTKPLPRVDPSALACLRDEVQTKRLNLRKLLPRNLSVSDRIYVAGRDVVDVLVRFDDNGGSVWESRHADSFELKGDPARTRQTIRKIASRFCAGPSRLVGGGTSGGVIGPKEAFRRAAEGAVTLVDIRHPSEWRNTGIAANAVAITMHQSIYAFVDQLKEVTRGNNRPIALICAEGVRSATMQKSLMEFGFKGVIDVRNGMKGNAKEPGWIRIGLPVKPYSPEQAELN